jgi:hypothetical protein
MVAMVKNLHAVITNNGLRMLLSAARWPFTTCSPTLLMAGAHHTSRSTYRRLGLANSSTGQRSARSTSSLESPNEVGFHLKRCRDQFLGDNLRYAVVGGIWVIDGGESIDKGPALAIVATW